LVSTTLTLDLHQHIYCKALQ